jgi:Spy/CpxP family protein refolding chaperone
MATKRLALLAVLALTLVSSGVMLAQEKAKGRGSLPSGWSKLGLSDDQKKQVYSLQAEYRTKIDALQLQIDELKKKERAELAKVLTPAQKARLKEILASKSGADTTEDKNKDKDKK